MPEASNQSAKLGSTSSFAKDAKPGPGAQRKFRFLRSGRLLRHSDFERVYKQGRKHFSANLTVFYLVGGGRAKDPTLRQAQGKLSRAKGAREMGHPAGLRVGFTVGRALGGAVERNRMKRRLREAVRLARPGVEVQVDVVINPKKSLLTAKFETVLNEVRRAFVVIEQKVGHREGGCGA